MNKSLKFILSAALLFFASAFAKTNQFRGVNWADKRDNFVSDVLVLSGLSLSDTYESAFQKSDRVVSQFMQLLGTNSLRIPVNEPTISKFWDTYKGVIDAAIAKGRVVMGYWGPAQPSGPKNMDDWWAMWKKLVGEFGANPNAYFELFNEPHMYSKNDLRNLYAQWLETFPDVPRDHIILDGTGMAQNVPDIADDSRFDGCLFAVHEYTFWNMGITTEEGWMNSFKGKVGKYSDRTVCTEWGGAMGPGDKAGVHYEKMDYNDPNPTNYFMAYIRGMSRQLHDWEMGSFYWVGLRDGDWYSMTQRDGGDDGMNLKIVNQSGVDRMHYAWTDTVPAVQEPFGEAPFAIPGKIQAEDYDKGGNGVSYYDKDSENKGGVYREDWVDIVQIDSTDKTKGYAIGHTQSGEWLEYSVNVSKKATYEVQASVATSSENAGLLFYMDNKVIGDTLKAPKGEDWVHYNTISTKAELDQGEGILKFVIVGNYLNVDWVNICENACEAPGDTIPDALKNYRAHFAGVKTFGVYDMSGRFIGHVTGMDAFEIRTKVRNELRYRGAYRLK